MEKHPPQNVGLHISSDPENTRLGPAAAPAAREVTELPLRLLLVSDLAPHTAPADWSSGPAPRSVDKNSFAALLQDLAPRLQIDVPNEVGAQPKALELDLAFPDLAAFEPEGLARQVPALARLLDLRGLIGDVQAQRVDVETFRSRLEEIRPDPAWAARLVEAFSADASSPSPRSSSSHPPPPSTAPNDALDRLLGMVSMGEGEKTSIPEAPASPSSFVEALIGAVSGEAPERPKADATAVEVLLADLDAAFGRQVNAMLGHSDVRRLEAAWRGLKFLVDRIDFRSGVRLDVLPASKEALGEALYHQVLMPEHGGAADRPPLGALVVDHAFGHSAAEVARLEDLAETAASLQVPLLANVAPGFFGVAREEGLAQLPVVWRHLDGPEYIVWNAFRERPEAQGVALALPSFLLRYPHDKSNAPFAFKENGHLWGGAALLVAAAAADSFARTGWPTHLGVGRRVGDLPLRQKGGKATPLAVQLSEEKQDELARAGFVVLGAEDNRDAAYVAHAPTARRPPAYDDPRATTEARAHATLPCQLFVARAAQYLLRLQDELEPGPTVEEQAADVEARLRAFLRGPEPLDPDAVTVQCVDEGPRQGTLTVRLRPPRWVLGRRISLAMGIQVPVE